MGKDLVYGTYDLEFYVGNFKSTLPENITIQKPSTNLFLVIGILFITIVLITIIIWLILRNKQKSQQNREEFQLELQEIVKLTNAGFQQQFHTICTDEGVDLNDLPNENLPYFSFGTYLEYGLYPKDNIALGKVPRMDNYGHGQETEEDQDQDFYQDLLNLLLNPTFFHALVQKLEVVHEHTPIEYQEIASLLSIILSNRAKDYTIIFEKIISNVAAAHGTETLWPKFLFRLNKIQERIVMNFIYWCMWPNLTTSEVGKKLFILIRATRKLQSTGPIDCIRHQATHTLSERVLLKQQVKFENLKVTVTVDEKINLYLEERKIEGRVFTVDLLSVDTILQAKEKILYQIYGHIPYSKWVSVQKVNLLCQDKLLEDGHEADGKLWTMAKYTQPVRTRDRDGIMHLKLLLKSENTNTIIDQGKHRKSSTSMVDKGSTDWSVESDKEAESSAFLAGPSPGNRKHHNSKAGRHNVHGSKYMDINNNSTSYEALHGNQTKVQKYHLVDPKTLEPENQANLNSHHGKSGRKSNKSGSRRKLLGSMSHKDKYNSSHGNNDIEGFTDEFHNLSLITTRRAIESYMKDALAATIPKNVNSVPIQLKYLLDFIDILIQENTQLNIKREVNHVWKSNCMFRKYWSQGILNKTENIFDIPENLLSNETLSLVAKIMNNACVYENIARPELSDDKTELIIFTQTSALQDDIRTHYRTVSEKTPVKKEDLIKFMEEVIRKETDDLGEFKNFRRVGWGKEKFFGPKNNFFPGQKILLCSTPLSPY